MQPLCAVTPERFWAAVVVFHLVVLAAMWRVARLWLTPERCRRPATSWLGALAGDAGGLALFAYAASLLAPIVMNLDDLARMRVDSISGRLMGQDLVGETLCKASRWLCPIAKRGGPGERRCSVGPRLASSRPMSKGTEWSPICFAFDTTMSTGPGTRRR